MNESICSDRLQIIQQHGLPHGIRDSNGFILFFPVTSEYIHQKERYVKECDQLQRLAEFLLESLQSTVTKRTVYVPYNVTMINRDRRETVLVMAEDFSDAVDNARQISRFENKILISVGLASDSTTPPNE